MPNEAVPNVLAMLVCDQVIAEQGSNKKSLIGIFDNINAFAFPTQMRLAVYAKLADARGHYDFRLRFVSLKDETTVLPDINIPVDITDPLSPAELAVNLLGVVISEPGKYEFQLWAGETYLHRITLNAILTGGPQWPQQPKQLQ
jgi:hypothetical protein